MNDNLAGFYLWLAQGGRKTSTIHCHVGNIKRVLPKCDLVDDESIASYLLQLTSSGKSHKYINNLIDSINVYRRYKKLDKLQLRYLKEQQIIKSTFSDEEIEAFLSLPPQTYKVHYSSGKVREKVCNQKAYHQWTLFFSIMAYTAMRPGEVAALSIDDIDKGRNIIHIRDSKTNTPRIVPIPQNIQQLLFDYISILDDSLLFRSRGGGKKYGKEVFDNVDWYYNFHQRMKRLGIKRKGLTPYSFRHSLITRLLEEDVALPKVMKIAGHSDIRTTYGYTHMTTKDIQEAIKKHPLVRKTTDPRFILQSLIELIKAFGLHKDNRFSYSYKETENTLSIQVEIL